MNYIVQIQGFWRVHEEHSFNTTEIALYFHLLEVCNICGWKNPFSRNNSKMCAQLSVSFNTLANARKKLKEAGLISFETTNGSAAVIYTLSNFKKVSDEVESEIPDSGSETHTTSSNFNVVSDEVIDEVSDKVGEIQENASSNFDEVTSEVLPQKCLPRQNLMRLSTRLLMSKYKLNKTELDLFKLNNSPPKSPNLERKNGLSKFDEVIDKVTLLDWRDSFEIYHAQVMDAFQRLSNDSEFIKKQEKNYPEINVAKTLEMACNEYWGTKSGWEKKKTGKESEIDWGFTFAGSCGHWRNQIKKKKKTAVVVENVNFQENRDLFLFLEKYEKCQEVSEEGYNRYQESVIENLAKNSYTHLLIANVNGRKKIYATR